MLHDSDRRRRCVTEMSLLTSVYLTSIHTSRRFAARPFASSLESLSACDMNTIHSIADPHLRYEFSTKGGYCAPQRKQDGDARDYFEEYCNSVFFPNWPSCKNLAADLMAACDDEMELNIQK